MSELSDEVRAVFERMAGEADVRAAPEVRGKVREHLAEVRRAGEANGLLPVDIAEALAGALEELLDELPALPASQQRLVLAAARYFASDDDAVPDTGSVLGLDDDVAVFNHVVRAIGQPDRALNI